jgi:hypothetical protein
MPCNNAIQRTLMVRFNTTTRNNHVHSLMVKAFPNYDKNHIFVPTMDVMAAQLGNVMP